MRFLWFSLLLILQTVCYGQLRIVNSFNQDHLSLNHSGAQIGAASFTLTQPNEGYGGMYINSLGTNTAIPFYGYSVGNEAKAWHYYDKTGNFWGLYLDGEKVKISADSMVSYNTLSARDGIRINGFATMNTNQPINSKTDFTIKSKIVNDYGGMYIDVHGSGSSKPFYGYSVNGIPIAFTFFNELTETWSLNVGNTISNIIEANEYNVTVSGSITLRTENATSAPVGTIYYYQDHFYGNTPSGIKRLDNTTTSALKTDDEVTDAIEVLQAENEALKLKLEKLEQHFYELEQKVLMQKKEE